MTAKTMVEYKIPSDLTSPLMANAVHLKDSVFYASGDESIFPASTAYSECDSSSDMTSVLLTARSTNSTNLLEGNAADISVNDTSARQIDLKEYLSTNSPLIPGNRSKRVSPQLTNFFSEQSSSAFMPIPAESANSVNSPRSTPSPGISKMLRSLSDHPSERPCTPNASTLYKNTLTHCNPSELGQLTYDECMVSEWNREKKKGLFLERVNSPLREGVGIGKKKERIERKSREWKLEEWGKDLRNGLLGGENRMPGIG